MSTLLTCAFTLHRQVLNNITYCMLYYSAVDATLPCWTDLRSLWSVCLSCLINAAGRSCFSPVRIVLPAVLFRSGLSLWNVHLHRLSLTGRNAMCCLIDVWICLRRRDRLSHSSVRQNMCEQKWGHLWKIRNCAEEEGKNNIDKMIWVCLRRIWVLHACCVFI